MQNDVAQAAPWLSVLIPVYAVERYLEACVESVLGQAVDGVEILLLNDASPDRSGEIAVELQARLGRKAILGLSSSFVAKKFFVLMDCQ